jgi:hypothetical protein
LAHSIDAKKPAGLSFEIPSGLKMIKSLSASHKSLIYCIAWSPDGADLASGSDDKTIQLWDIENGKRLRTLKGHTDTIFSVAWSPGGKTLASGSQDKTIRLWDVETGEQLRILQEHTDSIFSVAWAPDGKTLASGGADRTILLWNAENGDQLDKLQGHQDLIYCVAWSPDGLILASGSYDQTIRLWDTRTKKLLRILAGHTNPILSVAWAPDGRTLASGSNDKTIRLWDTQTGELINILEGHTEKIAAIGFSSDGKLLSSSSPNEDCLWQSGDGKLITSVNKMLKKLRVWSSTAIAFHPSKAIWATLNELGIGIHIWGLDLAALLGKPANLPIQHQDVKTVSVEEARAAKTDLAMQIVSPELMQRVKDFLMGEKQAGRFLSTLNDLFFTYMKTEKITSYTEELFAQFITCVRQAESSGLIRRFCLGNLVLLQPEALDNYTAAVVNAVKEGSEGIGGISEAKVLKDQFKMAQQEWISDSEMEKLLITEAVEELLRHDLQFEDFIRKSLKMRDKPDSLKQRQELSCPKCGVDLTESQIHDA